MLVLCVLLPFVTTTAALCWEILGAGPMNPIGDSLAMTVVVVSGGVVALVLAIWGLLDGAMHRQRLQLAP